MSSDPVQVKENPPSYLPAADRTNVPWGYKRTEVGVIPEDWDTARLAELGRPLSGGTPRKSDARLWGGDIPWVSSKDMKVARLRDAIDHVTPLALGNGTRLVQAKTILMVVRGMSLAHSFPIAIVEAPVSFNQDIKAFVPNARVSAEFLLGWLEANQASILLLATEATHGTKRIPTHDLLESRIPLPESVEQRAIAEALSDVDGLLGALEALIAKKRDIKQAAMEQLLIGKTRLPGFSGEWETKRLSVDVVLLSGHHVLARDCNSRGVGFPYLTGPADFPCGRIQQTKFTTKPTTLCGAGDILVTVKGSGSGTLIEADDDYCISRQLMAIRTSCWNSRFLFYSLLQNASSIVAASTGLIPGLSRADILDQELPIPSESSEQDAIATVLSDMDAEIAALEARRDKTRAIKQGMMQQLLTGRVRLVKPKAAA